MIEIEVYKLGLQVTCWVLLGHGREVSLAGSSASASGVKGWSSCGRHCGSFIRKNV